MFDDDLLPATRDDLASALAFALNHDGRKSYRLGNEMMSRIVAQHLIEHLEMSGFVVMKRPARQPPSTPGRMI